jgi:hypothetical protein
VLDGVWLATFFGPGGSQGSVVTLRKGVLTGATTFCEYTGAYTAEHGSFKGRITIRSVLSFATDNFAGVAGKFTVEVSGHVEDDRRIEAFGCLQNNNAAIQMVLAKLPL